jgi:hypothetical protein
MTTLSALSKADKKRGRRGGKKKKADEIAVFYCSASLK